MDNIGVLYHPGLGVWDDSYANNPLCSMMYPPMGLENFYPYWCSYPIPSGSLMTQQVAFDDSWFSCNLNTDIVSNTVEIPFESSPVSSMQVTEITDDSEEKDKDSNEEVEVPLKKKRTTLRRTRRVKRRRHRRRYGNKECIICAAAPRTGIFVHGGTGHISCCYKCATHLHRSQHPCPDCNQAIENVLKTFQ